MSSKFHTSLNVSDLAQSIAFYRALLGQEPAKQKCDYAKFELDNPPLVLSLIPGRPNAGGTLNHVGLCVPDSEALVKVQSRLEAAGIRTQREEGVECCYAKQTKFWVTDPDRTLWELYIFHEDMDDHGDGSVPEAAQVESFAKDVPREKIIWQHQIADPAPARIPHDNNSVHEVLLEGTANLKPSAANLDAFLTETFRVLRPGGEVRIHGLSADATLPEVPLALPSPAAAVQHVPAARELERTLRRAGFVEVRFEKLSTKAYFEIAGIGLREVLLAGRKPGHRPRVANHAATYLGPMSQVTDDFGNVFPRGERVPLNIHDWQVLSKNSAASQFLFLSPAAK
jgi:catechol 2,3-dioxygenase-like lactoylglutathione lyase family enzyme